MRLVAAIIILIPAVTFLWIHDKSQILAPRNAFSVLYFLRIMLPAVIYANTGVAGRISDGYVSRAVLSNENYLSYAVLQTASYYCVIFGMRLVFGTRKYTFKHSNINVSQGIKTGESLGEENYKQEFASIGEHIGKAQNAEDSVAYVDLRFDTRENQVKFTNDIEEYVYTISS